MSRTPALAGFLETAARVLGAAGRWTVRAFTHSLQFRIVVLTIALTIIAVLGVGAYMSQQISRGLFESKLSSVSVQTAGYVAELQSLSAGEDDEALSETLNTQLRSMLSRSPTPLRSVALEPQERSTAVPPLVALVGGEESIPVAELPDAYLSAVDRAELGEQLYQSVTLPGEESSPGLVVAQQVTIPAAGQFELFVVADLQEEQNTLDFVLRALIVAAIVLSVLIGAIAWIVTRLVVVPVRTAAEVAGQLAHGDLDQRMPVHGKDEIATLAESFNSMADTLQDQITRMELLTVLQRQFVSDVSHELRTPLTTIHIASDMIYESREDFDESTARSAELLNSQVERFELLLGDLLEISRYDAGAANLVTKPTDIGEIVTGVLDTLSVVATQAGTELLLHAPSSPVMAEVDRVRITRVVRNLVVNAIEHGEGRRVDIYLAANAEAVAVSVRDHGIGMSEEHVEHVFDRFWRADPSRRRTLGGSGLGLAISLEDTHLHGGWLQAWGREGEGACFRLTLPRRQRQEISSSPLPLPPADAAHTGAAVVAGPSSSDGSVRIQTGSIPIVVDPAEAEYETD
ncbi:MtrAB system histidine kinase MtrB [Brevibacterium sp. CS2]|uniref:MtrAB system histidine kinase MtrB n=1 Tax=Brevibacterium sp. CS2 TaxID=2575923 RepID=UPI0010C774A5|nr:MtrAB system histidine kinase MtrB [Brevibacterium sp. CS2]QCP05276.1 HAMP domain-containing histidine kinase [Brevibacterium sp. CS2]